MLSKLYLDMFCLSVPRDFEAELQQCGSCRGWAGARSQIWRTSSQRHWALQGEPFYQPYLTLMVLQQMRKEMVDQKEGMNRLTVKVHMDDMKRVTIREQNYFYHNISNTPFTLGIAFPSKYGQFRVTGGTEITRNKADGGWIKISNDLASLSFPQRPKCSAPTAGSCTQTGCTASTTTPGRTTASLTHRRTTWGTSLIDSPMKGSSSTGAHPGAMERGLDRVLIFAARVRPLPTCAGNGGGFTADCPKCK